MPDEKNAKLNRKTAASRTRSTVPNKIPNPTEKSVAVVNGTKSSDTKSAISKTAKEDVLGDSATKPPVQTVNSDRSGDKDGIPAPPRQGENQSEHSETEVDMDLEGGARGGTENDTRRPEGVQFKLKSGSILFRVKKIKNAAKELYNTLSPDCLEIVIASIDWQNLGKWADTRPQFTLSSFGFLKHGTLSVNVSSFVITEGIRKLDNMSVGFTLDVSSSSGAGGYMEDYTDKCILRDKVGNAGQDKNEEESIVFFRMDLKRLKLVIERRGKALQNLLILDHVEVQTKKPEVVAENTVTNVTAENGTETAKVKREDKVKILTEVPITKSGDNSDIYSFFFMITVTESQQEGMYNLIFHNCLNFGDTEDSEINLVLELTEDNNGNYLSAGKMQLPHLYFILSLMYLVVAVVWNTVLCKSKEAVYKMHYLMLVVVFVKSLACLFHAINFHYIQKEGIHEEAWAILFYIAYLTRGALLFITIILIGSGWAFIKHVLSDKEKKLFLIVIPLQILDNIAWIILEESEEGQSQYTIWKEIFILIDLLCCGAILFPVVWSIRHLQEASKADGKAELSLTKLKLFRQFYILVVCYIYFTRIIVYLLKMTVPFKYLWLNELFRELATVVFFVTTGYKFKPASDNPYLQVPSDDEEDIEMDTVLVGESSTIDTVKRVNQAYRDDDTPSTKPKLRESSHEYD